MRHEHIHKTIFSVINAPFRVPVMPKGLFGIFAEVAGSDPAWMLY